MLASNRLSALQTKALTGLLRSTAGLSVIGASIGLALAQCSGKWTVNWFETNAVPQSWRVSILVSMLAGAFLALLSGGVVFVRWGTSGLRAFCRLLAPLVLSGTFPALLRTSAWPNDLTLSLAAAAVVLASGPLFALHVSAYGELPVRVLAARARLFWSSRLDQSIPAGVRGKALPSAVAVAAVGYAAYMAFYCVRNHHRFDTFTWDLGQFDSEFFNTLKGKPFRCPALLREDTWSDLRSHAHFATWLLLPFYALYPSAETLLVLQAVIVGISAIPLYRFAARRLPQSIAAVISVSYLLYAPLHGAQLFDFHFQPIAAGFLLAAIDCIDARRMRLFAFFFVAALACREDVSIGCAVIGFYLLLFGERPLHGSVVLIISVAYFVLIRFVIMPAIGPWGFSDLYSGLVPPGQKGFGAVIVTLVTNPIFAFKSLLTADKLKYLLQILTPVAFLPLRYPRLWLFLIPGAIVTLLTTDYPATTDIAYQYGSSFAPYLFVASVLSLSPQTRFRPEFLALPPRGSRGQLAGVLALVLGTFLTTVHWGAIPPREQFRSTYGHILTFAPLNEAQRSRLDAVKRFAKMVPPRAILAASDRELPHVSNRIDVWNLSTGYEGADYILYDPVDAPAAERSQVHKARAAGWVQIAEHPRAVLLKRPGAE